MTLFGESHDRLRGELRQFIETRFLPRANEWEERSELPRSVFRELGKAGYLGLTYPREYGGRGLDFGHAVVLAEELPRSHMGGLTLSVLAQVNFFLPLLARYGTERQRRDFMMPAIQGDLIGALASTEPAGGSDITGATSCSADQDGDFWILSGEKKYITNGPIADFVVALARTSPGNGPYGLSLIIVPTTTAGFSVKETLRKLGLHTSPTGWLSFDRCRIPRSLTIGRPDLGYFYHTQNLLEERLIAGVTSIAFAALVLEDTIAYVKQRQAFGSPISHLQTVRHNIVEMASEIDMARAFVYATCEDFRDGRSNSKAICMIKFQVVQIVQRVVERCIQLFGGFGFLEENWVSRAYRDVRVLSLGGGTSEVMKDLVAQYLRL